MGRWFKSADYRASQIVKGLYDRGVDLFVEGGRLNYKSRIEGTVTNDDLVDLDENKAEIIALLLLLKEGMPNNVIPFPAPRDGCETDEALDNWTATLADRDLDLNFGGEGYPRDKVFGFYEASSEFYPDVGRLVDSRVSNWLREQRSGRAAS